MADISSCSPDIRALIVDCLSKNPEERPSAGELVAYAALQVANVSKAGKEQKIRISEDLIRYQKRGTFARKL